LTITTTGTTDTKGTGHYAKVNGLNLYYEIHGAGRPLILLHGGLMSNETFGPVLPQLAERHQVIAPDLQGHGRTADIDRPIDVRLMADDISALIDHLGLETPDLVGYSLGGGVALHTAAKYPAKVRRLVAVSANIRPDAIYAEMRVQQGQVGAAAAEFMKDTPMYQLYHRVAPRPEDFPTLLDKLGVDGEGLRLRRRGPRSPGAHAHRRRRRRHGSAEPLRRGFQAARRRCARWWLDGRGPAGGRSRTCDLARPDPLQHRRLATARCGSPRLPRRPAGLITQRRDRRCQAAATS